MFRDTITKFVHTSPLHDLVAALQRDSRLHAAIFTGPGKAHAYAEVLEPVGEQVIAILTSPTPDALELRDVLLQFSIRHALDRDLEGSGTESHLVMLFDSTPSAPPALALFPHSHTRTVIVVNRKME
jgi:hypothetical protein